ncbi:NB-ARC domain-containing protein [Lentzea jiangxiensis]|uniref:ATP-binding protein n=1 Tax=Lentzea jiangxiensis TaxID=641025 RepID=UPI000B17A94A
MTQEELAEASGVSVRAISDMERGIAKCPQRRTIDALVGPLALSDDESAQLREVAKRARVSSAPESVALPAQRTPARSAPAQLPADLNDFTGSERELEELRPFLRVRMAGGQTGRVTLLSGAPGTGKTSLAVHAAHELAAHFPDGQLFLKLRGMSNGPADVADVLQLVLRSLGVESTLIPAEQEHRASLCRSLLADRAVLIVLDDAADEAQVRPLLVGGPRSVTLVTSRQVLPGLAGVGRFGLGVLTPYDALALLRSIVGAGRVSAESDAAEDLVGLCGGLPLAIRIAGNRLASRPTWPLSYFVSQLRSRNRRLTALTAGDLDVRRVFDLSYRQLGPVAAAMFRRLALVPGPDFAVEAARMLVDGHERDAGVVLDELADASLVQPAPEDGRYQLHDLLREFAAEMLTEAETGETVREVEQRLDRWLVRTAAAAGRYFQPSSSVRTPPKPTESFADSAGARRWLETETGNWLAALRRSAARAEHHQVVDLASAMYWYPEFGGTADLWHEVFTLALQSAVALGCKREEAAQRNYMAWVLGTLLSSADGAAGSGRRGRGRRSAGAELGFALPQHHAQSPGGPARVGGGFQ